MIYQYLDKTPEFAVPFNGWVADSAQVMGDVYLGHQANIWFGAVIRGDNDRIHIGDYSNVQENSVIHTDAGIEVKIGKNCLIGAKALITEGQVIPDNSLVMGAPAKVVKTLTDEQAAMLKMSALHYAERCQKFKTGLTEIAMPD